jgi:hypothetical protein
VTGKIYLVQGDGTLQSLSEQSYSSEDLLQTLLEKYPDLLAGEQIDALAPRRWLLVSREVGVPGEEEGYDQWSLDHLFLDQDAVPTLVEVKRSSDTRIRREVVGQMLDYAANAVVYWPVETIRARFEAACESQGHDPGQLIAQLIDADPGDDTVVEAFWDQVKTNLRAGRIRLIFVADEIPPELRRVVEFLNKQMDPAEVLAVEIRQYVGKGLRTLVPRVIGQTAEAQQKKSRVTRTRQWDADSFFQVLEAREKPGEVEVARRILEWATIRSLRIWWGQGAQDGSFYPMLDYHGDSHYTIAVRTGYRNAHIQVQFAMMQAPLDNEAKRHELRQRLNGIPGVDIPPDGITRYPSIYLSVLQDESAQRQFLEVLDGLIDEIRSTDRRCL